MAFQLFTDYDQSRSRTTGYLKGFNFQYGKNINNKSIGSFIESDYLSDFKSIVYPTVVDIQSNSIILKRFEDIMEKDYKVIYFLYINNLISTGFKCGIVYEIPTNLPKTLTLKFPIGVLPSFLYDLSEYHLLKPFSDLQEFKSVEQNRLTEKSALDFIEEEVFTSSIYLNPFSICQNS